MKYIANKTITRHQYPKAAVVIRKGKTYSKEQVDAMPSWYLSDSYLTEVK